MIHTDHLADVIRATAPRQPNPGAATPDHILATTARLFAVTVEEITGPSRSRHIVDARQVAMTVIRASTPLSYPSIGLLFGGRHHRTVMSAVERVMGSDVMRGWASAVDLEVASIEPEPARRCSKNRPPHGGST